MVKVVLVQKQNSNDFVWAVGNMLKKIVKQDKNYKISYSNYKDRYSALITYETE